MTADALRATLYVFAYSGLIGATHICIAEELRAWPELQHGVVQDDALIDRSRGKAATHFFLNKDGGDVMLMVDHDLIWQKGDLKYLAEKAAETRGVVAAVYSKRSFHQGQTFRIAEPCKFRIGDDVLVPATYVTTGFIAIHRDVINRAVSQVPLVVQNFYPVFTPMVVKTDLGWEHLSEDWAFCHRVKEPIHIAAKVNLKHSGSYQYRMIDSLSEPPDGKGVTVEITHEGERVVEYL